MRKIENLKIAIAMLFLKITVKIKKIYNCLKVQVISLHIAGMQAVHAYQTRIYDPTFTNMATVGGTKTGEWIGMAIGVIVMVLMLPPVADTVLGINTTGWTFTGAEACKTLMYLIPMVYIAAVIVKIVKTALD